MHAIKKSCQKVNSFYIGSKLPRNHKILWSIQGITYLFWFLQLINLLQDMNTETLNSWTCAFKSSEKVKWRTTLKTSSVALHTVCTCVLFCFSASVLDMLIQTHSFFWEIQWMTSKFYCVSLKLVKYYEGRFKLTYINVCPHLSEQYH